MFILKFLFIIENVPVSKFSSPDVSARVSFIITSTTFAFPFNDDSIPFPLIINSLAVISRSKNVKMDFFVFFACYRYILGYLRIKLIYPRKVIQILSIQIDLY